MALPLNVQLRRLLQSRNRTLLKVGLTTQETFASACLFDENTYSQRHQSTFLTSSLISNVEKKCPRGESFDLFTILARLGGVNDFQLVQSEGNVDALFSNGSWHGLAGQLARREIDATGSLLTESDDDALRRVIRYTIPVATSDYGLVVHLPDAKVGASLFSLFQPFTWRVWFAVACSILVMNVILKNARWRAALSTISKRLLLTTVAIFYFLVFRQYKSNLYTMFVAPATSPLPFNSLETFADAFAEGRVQFITTGWSSGAMRLVNKSDLEPWRKIREAAVHNPILVATSHDEMVKLIAQTPNLAARISYMAFKASARDVCNVTFIRISMSFLAYAFDKSAETKFLADTFSSVMYGEGFSVDDYNAMLLRHYIRTRRCAHEEETTITRMYRPRTIRQMQSPFAFWFTGMFFALCLCSIELMAARFWHNRSQAYVLDHKGD